MQVTPTKTKLKLARAVIADTILANSFGLNVCSASKHTNCNYLWEWKRKESIPLLFEHQKLSLRECRGNH
jgi:hypothetical protein